MNQNPHVFSPPRPHSVLFIDSSPCFGGAQRSLLSLLRTLDRNRIRPLLLSPATTDSELISRCRKDKIPAFPLQISPWQRNLSGLLTAAMDCRPARRQLTDILRREPIKLIYANGMHAAAFCSLFAPASIPLITHHRDWDCPQWIWQRIVARSATVITVSDASQHHSCRTLSPKLQAKVQRIYNGLTPLPTLSPDQDRRTLRARLNIPETAPVLLQVADMIPWKNHRLFLTAFQQVLNALPDAVAVIAGGARDKRGEEVEAELRGQAESFPPRRILFTGMIPDALPLIASADLLVSPAATEPFGRTAVEALSCGIPVIAMAGSGTAEIIRSCPAATITDPEHLGTVMLAVLLQQKRPAVRLRWRRQAMAHAARFSIHAHTQAVTRLIQETIQAFGTTEQNPDSLVP